MVPTATQKVDPQYWLLKVLCAVVKSQGGRVAVDDDCIAGIAAGATVVTKHEPTNGSWVIEFVAEAPQVFVMGSSPTDAAAWTKPPETRAALNPSLLRSIRREDDEVAELEQRWKTEAAVRSMQSPTELR